jgi:hypothetical protein
MDRVQHMQSIVLVTIPILLVGTEFAIEKMREREKRAMKELITKLPCLKQHYFQIAYDFKISEEWLAIVVKAIDVQINLHLADAKPTLTEFKRNVLHEIENLPGKLNFLVLQELAEDVFEHSLQVTPSPDQELRAYLKKNSGKSDIYELDGQRRLVFNPESKPNKANDPPRRIQCVIKQKLRFHALITQVRDSVEPTRVKSNKTFKLNVEDFMQDDAFHIYIGPYMRFASTIEIDVKPIRSAATNEIQEYLLVGYRRSLEDMN